MGERVQMDFSPILHILVNELCIINKWRGGSRSYCQLINKACRDTIIVYTLFRLDKTLMYKIFKGVLL